MVASSQGGKMEAIITRSEAMSRGLKRYFNGAPCKLGHIAERIVSSYECCECNRIKALEHHRKNREASLAKMAKRRANPAARAATIAYLAEYRQKPENIAARKEWWREKYKSDEVFAVAKRARGLVSDSLNRRGFKKTSRTAQILGCTIQEFKQHIERQFLKGMTWENRSKWELDHIVPIASATTQDEAIALNHYTNLRPLWREDNRSKSAKILTLL